MGKLSKRMIGAVAVALVWALSVPAVQADPWNVYSVREGGRQNGAEGQRANRQSEDRRQYYQRDDGRDAQRAQRLSPDERRQLRRDIRDAGREIYPGRR